MSRWTAVVLLIGVLLAGVVYDRVDIAPGPELAAAVDARITPSIAADPALSTVWYCPVGSGSPEGVGTNVLTMSNLADEPAVANVNLLNGEGAGPTLRLDLAPRSTEVLDVSALDPSVLVGAVVEVVGGQGVVGHTVVTPQGVAQSPCGTETSDRWYFADGVTTRDARNYLVLLNPFSQDVVFDVAFQTATRTRLPEELQAAVVPGRSVRLIDVSQYVSREPHVATTITTVQGRLAVERIQFFDGQLGPTGVSLTSAVDRPQLEWFLPAGRVHPGGDHRLTLFNPNDAVAEIDIELQLTDPTARATYGLVPIEVTVSPGRLAIIDLVAELERTGVPVPAEVGVAVRSTNDVGVVVERWQVTPRIDTTLIGAGGDEAGATAGSGEGTSVVISPLRLPSAFPRQDGADVESPENEVVDPALEVPEVLLQPTAIAGVAVSHGASVLSTDWFVPTVTIGAADETAVVVWSPEGGLVSVQLMVAGELLPPIRAMVPADGRVQIVVTGPVAEAPMLVTSESPVSAEVQVVTPEGRLAVVPGVPVVGATP